MLFLFLIDVYQYCPSVVGPDGDKNRKVPVFIDCIIDTKKQKQTTQTMFDKVSFEINATEVGATLDAQGNETRGVDDTTHTLGIGTSNFDKTPHDPEFTNIKVDYIQLGSGAASVYPLYLDDQELLVDVDNQIERAKQNDDITTLRHILQTYKPLYQSVKSRKEKIDKCAAALNDAKIAKNKSKAIPAADLTIEDLDEWQSWIDIENTCENLLSAHVANSTMRANRKRPRAAEANANSFLQGAQAVANANGEKNGGHENENADVEADLLILDPTGKKKKNPNEEIIISAIVWEKALSKPWTHRKFSGEHKRDQGLVLIPPNLIYCKVCNKSCIQFSRIAQHICGQRHRDGIEAFRKKRMKKKNRTEAKEAESEDDDDDDDGDHDSSKAASELEKACKLEVLRLQKFLLDWRTGEIPKSENNFKLLSSALSTDFQIISATGEIIGREDLMKSIVKSYNTCEKGRISIDIRNSRLIRSGKTCFMTYEEWQKIDSTTATAIPTATATTTTTTARTATVIFRKLTKGSGLEWMHVQETWIPGKEPSSDMLKTPHVSDARQFFF